MITISTKKTRVRGVEMQRVFANDEKTALVIYPYENQHVRSVRGVSVECKELRADPIGDVPAGVSVPIFKAFNRNRALETIARIVAEVTGEPTRVEGFTHVALRGGGDEYDADDNQ